MIEISAYIFLAILLGYFFGWLITKLLLKERYQTHLDEIVVSNNIETEELSGLKEEIYQYKKDNKRLKHQNKELNSGYTGQRYVLEEHNTTLDEFQKRLHSKDEVIASLTSKLSLTEEKQMQIEKKYEEEIDAFMFERIEITQKYKDLLKKFNLLKEHKRMLKDKDSWFSNFFSLPSKVH
jgi:antitoxin component HigA of HigAB toxin-antitoxin module